MRIEIHFDRLRNPNSIHFFLLEQEFDLDAVKPTDQLKHMQRAKPPSKHPPSKFKVITNLNLSFELNFFYLHSIFTGNRYMATRT